MRPISQEGGDGSAQRGRSVISTIALFSYVIRQRTVSCNQRPPSARYLSQSDDVFYLSFGYSSDSEQ